MMYKGARAAVLRELGASGEHGEALSSGIIIAGLGARALRAPFEEGAGICHSSALTRTPADP